jgi:hypothetical protein
MGGGMSKVKVIATANANQTWATQIGQIASTFNALSADEKAITFIRSSNGIFTIQNLTGIFMRSALDASDASYPFFFASIYLASSKYSTATFIKSNNSWSFTNNSTSNNTDSLELCIKA